ncbi:MotA/TolQ/ExbB proton channel family protein [Rhizobium leguminosarum]|uniref:MotA/TolQ/ExbB proton channel family protein n=1 Tax=Rhizobium leguminosarum TaxID=384 RepID=UPI0028F44A1A|nr:MotA/TolQ/ExbB proton channel family protein [Rhizobium leguminosarum]
MQFIISVGDFVRASILFFAGLLTHESAPGFIAFMLLVALVAASIAFAVRVDKQRKAILWLKSQISASANEYDFSRDIEALCARIQEKARSLHQQQVAHAWTEYRETFVPHEEHGKVILRNAVRPSTFFNVDDLGFGAGAWRITPGLFVTIGLFLTFLGLISALNAMSQGTRIDSDTMRTLLSIASAKFIMSLTGLFCSIIFTVVFRRLYGKLLQAIHKLCEEIERKLTYISLEALATEQLHAVREQREHFRIIGMELVAELGRPLREELPKAISNSITEAMAPVVDRVGKLGAEGVGDMVSGLSSKLTDTVGLALSDASQRLAEAGSKIGLLADRMDQSSGRMGQEMEATTARVAQAVEDLRKSMTATAQSTGGAFTQGAEQLLDVMNQTLEGIRSNTGEGARAITEAATEMRTAAEAFRSEIEQAAKSGSDAAHARMQAAAADASGSIGAAGESLVAAFGKTSADIARVSEEAALKASREIMAPLEDIAGQLKEMLSGLNQGNADLRRMAEGVRAGADASADAAGSFRAASSDLVSAASPIRNATERMENSVRQLADSTQHVATVVSRSAESTAEAAAAALESARQVLGQEARAIEASLTGLTTLVDRMRGQGDRLDEMDTKLGSAFETYTDQVARAIDGMFGHVRDMQERLNPALDTMREIVEQAEQFAPQSRRA